MNYFIARMKNCSLLILFIIGTQFVSSSFPFKMYSHNSGQFKSQEYRHHPTKTHGFVHFYPSDSFNPNPNPNPPAPHNSDKFYSRVGRNEHSHNPPQSLTIMANKWTNSGRNLDKLTKLSQTQISSMDSGSNSNDFSNQLKNQNRISEYKEDQTWNPTPNTEEHEEGGIKQNLALLASALTQGLNPAVMTKLTNSVDEQVPMNLLHLFKNFVAVGNRIVGLWDKKTRLSRDGKSGHPGPFEMLSYGLDQLKRLHEGQPFLVEDRVSDATSTSQALFEGVMMVRRLWKRVLSIEEEYGADNELTENVVQDRRAVTKTRGTNRY